jgi:hypothetical protein
MSQIRPALTVGAILGLLVATGSAGASNNSNQAAIDACIDELMQSGLASAPGGTVLGSSFSEAGTVVFLQDGGGEVWRCIAYTDGSVGVLAKATAQQMEAVRSAPPLSEYQEVVRFEPGTNGATLTRSLGPGESFQFLLGANEDQAMSIRISAQDGAMYYVVRNPDQSIMSPGTDAQTAFDGRLEQSGLHVVEVINQTSESLTYDIFFEIR